jgi:hypothetical protein
MDIKLYGCIPDTCLINHTHYPAIKGIIMSNSKLAPSSCQPVDWDLWGWPAAKLNTTKLIGITKCVHKEWPMGPCLHW